MTAWSDANQKLVGVLAMGWRLLQWWLAESAEITRCSDGRVVRCWSSYNCTSLA